MAKREGMGEEEEERGLRSTGCIISSSISNVVVHVRARTSMHGCSIHARRISKLVALPVAFRKRISRRIITRDRFFVAQKTEPSPSLPSRFARFRGIFCNPIYRHSLGLPEPSFFRASRCEGGVRSRRDRAYVCADSSKNWQHQFL